MGEKEESWEEEEKDEGVHCAGFGVSRGCWLPCRSMEDRMLVLYGRCPIGGSFFKGL